MNLENGNEKNITVGYSNTFHDSSMAIISQENIYAEGFERITQSKRAHCFGGSIKYTLRNLPQTLKNIGMNPDSPQEMTLCSTWKLNLIEKLIYRTFGVIYKVGMQFSKSGKASPSLSGISFYKQGWFLNTVPIVKYHLKAHVFNNNLKLALSKKIRHHLTHAANAMYTSPFSESLIMVLDGSGESEASAFFHYKNGTFKLLETNRDSLGFLYAEITVKCGFNPSDGEEWKVMGLASYGKFNEKIYNFFHSRTKIDGLKYKLNYSKFSQENFVELEKICGGFRQSEDPDILKAADLAFNFQKYFTDVIGILAKNLQETGLSDNLCFSGGCALNSSTNGKILERSGFKNLHVPSAPGDDGNSLGAALFEQYTQNKTPYIPKTMSPYLGSLPNFKELERILQFKGLSYEKIEDDQKRADKIANWLIEGDIVGLMQGRAEFGPRALGNRSILADPRQANMKDKINALVKFRESYRPLAPSILHSHGKEYFINYQYSPYMERTLEFRPEVRDKVPAVVHVDGTGRLQSVTKEMNPFYHQLISTFNEKTGVPILLNTSLNIMGKPIVHSVEDAFTLYMTTGLHRLVIGPYCISTI